MGTFEWADLAELRTRTSAKWRRYGEDVLPLWVAEMDARLAPALRRALEGALVRGDTGYPWGDDYAAAYRGFARERWGWDGPGPGAVSLVPDVMHGVAEALALLGGPGDPVVVTPPVYPPFFAVAERAQRPIEEAPLNPRGRIDPATLASALARAAAASPRAALLLSNPHNPTGSVPTGAELAGVAALARAHGVSVISDEIHSPLVLSGARFTPYLSLPDTEDALAVVSASKGWNLAGLKAALVMAGPARVAELARLPESVAHGAGHVAALAHGAAFAQGGSWLDELLVALDENRRLLGELVAAYLPGVVYRVPEGTYLAWLDCAGLELSDPAGFFLELAGVALSPGPDFGTGGSGAVRLNFATSPAILTMAIEKMAGALAAGR
ncbi:MAG: aminotransferase class I/II-fold pyridoxal phosphate-dependent enzyme [Acidimicrobiales bacterium]